MTRPLLLLAAILFLFFSITAKATPIVTVGPVSGTITACAGTASLSPQIQQFTFTGSGLTGGITVTAPANFEVSLSPTTGYTAGFTIPQTGGQVAATTIYVRSSSAALAGAINGNVMLATPGTTTATAYVSGTINALPTGNPIPDQTVFNTNSTTAVDFTGTGNEYTWVNDSPGIGLAASGSGDIPSFQAINTGTTPVKETITVTPKSAGYAYIANAGDGTVSVINTLTNTVETTVTVGSGPEGVACSADGKEVYIANQGSGTVSVINTGNNTVVNTFKAGTYPFGIALSPDGSQLFVVNTTQGIDIPGKVSVIATATGNLLSTITVGFSPAAIVLSPDGSIAYVTNGEDGTVSVISTQSDAVIKTIELHQLLFGEAISPDGKTLYVVNNYADMVYVVSTVSDAILASIPVGSQSSEIAVSPDGSTAYVTNFLDGTLSVINTATNMVTGTIPAGASPLGIAITADGSQIYVTNASTNTVSLISTATGAVQNIVKVGSDPASFGSFIIPGTGCSGQPFTFTITVNPTVPTIIAGPLSGEITACAGSPSASPNIAQLTVSGDFLSAAITASSTAGFEISLSPSGGYSTMLPMPETGGSVPNTVIYVRSAASAPAGPISGTLKLTSGSAPEQDITLAGTVNALPVVAPVSSQTVMNGTLTAPVNFSGTAAAYDWTNDTPSIGLSASGSGNIAAFTAVNTGNIAVTATITVTPKPLSAAYIPASIDDNVWVINTANNTLITRIPVGQSPYGVAVSPDGLRAYISNVLDGTISVISTQTNKVIATIPVGQNPLGISVSPDNSFVYVANEASNTVSVISSATNKVVNTITTGIYPVFTLVSPDGTRLYVANQDDHSISVFTTGSYALLTTMQFQNDEPYQMATNREGSLLYFVSLGNNNTFYVVDTKTFSVITSFPVGQNAHALALTPDGSKIYVPNTGAGTVSVISTATNSIIKTISVGEGVDGVSITADGNYVYVVDENPGSSSFVDLINTATDQAIETFSIGSGAVSFGNFITPGADCDGIPQTFTITVEPTPKPFITASASTGNIIACQGTASSSPNIQTFSVSGGNLTDVILASATAGFELATDPSGPYNSSLTLPANSGTVNATIYARSSASAPPGNITGTVTLSSAGADNQVVTLNGYVAATPVVNQAPDQVLVNGTTTAEIQFTGSTTGYSWTNDTPAIGLGAGGTGALPSFTAVNTSTMPIIATIVVNSFSSAGCPGPPMTFKITVYPSPVIIAGTTLTMLSTIYGTPSASEALVITGVNLSSGILLTPAAGFELSTDNNTFSSSVSLPATGGTVYIRLAAITPVGSYSGNIVCGSTGISSSNIAIPASEVNPAPLIITANNQSKYYLDPNPPLTVSYSGFVNGETRSALTVLPRVTTTAIAASAPGTYTLMAGGAKDDNYAISYLSGTLTVKPRPAGIIVPNTFTPNGDGINDTWVIENIEGFPNCSVRIYTRYGAQVFYSTGYAVPWNGTYKGSNVNSGTYYYIIELNDGSAPVAGELMVIR